MQSLDPVTGERLKTAMSATSYMSELDEDAKHFRRQFWNNRSTLNTPFQPAWNKYSREDQLNVNLELHPYWVAKSPGTFDHTRERWNLYQLPAPRAPRARPQTYWDARFISAHVRKAQGR